MYAKLACDGPLKLYVCLSHYKQMAEQILGYGQLDERYLATINVMTAWREVYVATTLISNSGYLHCYILDINVRIKLRNKIIIQL